MRTVERKEGIPGEKQLGSGERLQVLCTLLTAAYDQSKTPVLLSFFSAGRGNIGI